MKVLLIGYGSIAKKHIVALKQIHPNVQICALRSSNKADKIEGIVNIYDYSEVTDIDFIMICNPTNLHFETFQEVLKFKKPIFLEKPPFDTLDKVEVLMNEIVKQDIPVYTAFNLRFLSCLQYLKSEIKIEDVQEVNIYCGSHLPDWRPDQDFRKVYSANEVMGGGVHLDLIHELDYAIWLFGQPTSNSSIKRSVSKLEIDAIDYAHYNLIYNGFVANITLNYFRKEPKRTIEIVTSERTIACDLIKNEVKDLTNHKLLFVSKQRVVDTYALQLEYFIKTVLSNSNYFNHLAESIQTLKIALS